MRILEIIAIEISSQCTTKYCEETLKETSGSSLD